MKNKEHEAILQVAFEMIDDDDSTEYMIEFMKDNLIELSPTPIDEYTAHDKVIKFLESISDESR